MTQLSLVALCCISATLRSTTATEASKAAFPASHTELSRAEAQDYRRQFSQIDRDADGKITASELAKALLTPEQPGKAVTNNGAADSTHSTKAEKTGDGTPAEVPAVRDGSSELPVESSAGERPPLVRLAEQAMQIAQGAMQMGSPAAAQPDQQAMQMAQGAMQMGGAAAAQPDQGEQPVQEFFKHDLAFVHVPMNFGRMVERAALEGNREEETPFILYGSFNAKTLKEQWEQISSVQGAGGQVWGTMYPELRMVSNYSGCNLVYEPPKHWPAELAQAYFGARRPFGLLRDPYDRLISEFRDQASGGGKQAVDFKRSEVSEREGSLEREGPEYQALYSNCDINGWVKAEMRHYKAGDQFRGNCHLLPQAEYFEHPHGISLPIDMRLLPDSFNAEMERHGYAMQLKIAGMRHNWSCSKLSVWDLDDESKRLIREVYAADFDLLCRHFGYCDNQELTCLAQIPFMCGAASSMN